eukprot:1416014-Amphidinium_carterae.2
MVGRVGLFHLDEPGAEYGRGGWLPAHMFVMSQSSGGKRKLTLVDNFSMLGRSLTDARLDFEDVERRSWSCSVDPACRKCGAKVVCRTLDLRSADKQLGVAEEDDVLFALLFGATASVFAFNKCARCLELLLWAGAGLVNSSYFDDRGYTYHKMDVSSTVLGARLDIGGSLLTLGNTQHGIDEILAMVRSVKEDGKWTSATAARLNFLMSLCLGRPLTPVMHLVHARAAAGGLCRRFTLQEASALDAMPVTMRCVHPRLVSVAPAGPPVII